MLRVSVTRPAEAAHVQFSFLSFVRSAAPFAVSRYAAPDARRLVRDSHFHQAALQRLDSVIGSEVVGGATNSEWRQLCALKGHTTRRTAP